MLEEQKIYTKAIETWGAKAQSDMMVEECSELIQALSKINRAKTEEDIQKRLDNVCEEIADVEILLAQMKTLFGYEKVEEWKKRKLERLKKLLNK